MFVDNFLPHAQCVSFGAGGDCGCFLRIQRGTSDNNTVLYVCPSNMNEQGRQWWSTVQPQESETSSLLYVLLLLLCDFPGSVSQYIFLLVYLQICSCPVTVSPNDLPNAPTPSATFLYPDYNYTYCYYYD